METIFLIVFIVFGSVFTFVIPPGWNTDEPNHTYRISQLSKGNLFSEKTTDPQTGLRAYGGEVSVSLQQLYRSTGSLEPGAAPNPAKKVTDRLYFNNPEVTGLKEDGKTAAINFSGAALYSPVSYLIYLPFFWLGTALSIPYIWIIIACRLLGVVLTGLAFYFAIKLTPIGKWIVLAVGLIPAVVVQAATVGADAPQLAVSILFVAYIAKLLFAPPDKKTWSYGALFLLGSALVLIKLAYAPMLLLLGLPFLLREYRNRRTFLMAAGIITVSLAAGLIWTRLVAYIDINSNPQADFAGQKAFLLHHPLGYIKTLYYTFFTNTQPNATSNLFGSFIWDSVPLPAIYAYAAAASLVCSLFARDKLEAKLSVLSDAQLKIWRGGLIFTTVLTVGVIATALYIYSTTYRQSSIVGIQSRYFIPLLPLIMLAFYGNFVKNQRAVKTGVIVLSCIAITGAVLAIFFRLYQTPSLII